MSSPSIRTSAGKLDILVELSDVSHLDTTNDKSNVNQIRRLLVSWLCLLADSPLSANYGYKPPRVLSAFRKEFVQGPLVSVIKRYASLADKLVSSTSLYGEGSLTGPFIPEFLDTPVFKEYHIWFQTGDSGILSYLLSFLYFGKKMKFEDENLHTTALRGWYEVEDRLSGLELDPEILYGLRRVMGELCPDLTIDVFRPKFGPGAVADRGVRGSIAKANHLGYHNRLDRVFFKGTFSNYGLSEEKGLHYEKVLPDPSCWSDASHNTLDVSTLRFVPKDVSKSRSICMEPNSFMFFQQAVQTALREVMRNSLAAQFVDIEDQSRNRALARYGSMSGDIDTIDLSSASDSVSTELVRAIFPRKVLYYLLGTRTSQVRTPDGELVSVKKFAPMGSALCFPVQCLIFTSVVVLSAMHVVNGIAVGGTLSRQCIDATDVAKFCRKYFRQKTGYVFGQSFQPAAVYGDDICVDSSLTQTVIHLLSQLGFQVNDKKSFTGSQAFRESCGGYYFNGEDVTPQFYRIENFKEVVSPEGVASLIAACNHAGDRGWRHLSRYYLHILLDEKLQGIYPVNGKNPIVFTRDRQATYGIYHKEPRNWHLRNRFNHDYQRFELQCVQMTADKRTRATTFEKWAHERYLYLQWWNGRAGGDSVEFKFAASRFDASRSRLVRRWIPLQAA